METILFIFSATISVHYLIKVISCCCGNDMKLPAPILHIWNIAFSNTYISTPAIAYQIFFWAKHFGIIGV